MNIAQANDRLARELNPSIKRMDELASTLWHAEENGEIIEKSNGLYERIENEEEN